MVEKDNASKDGKEDWDVRCVEGVEEPNEETDRINGHWRWRKYGTKKLRKAKPAIERDYFRCSFMCCPARKYVDNAKDEKNKKVSFYAKHQHLNTRPQGMAPTIFMPMAPQQPQREVMPIEPPAPPAVTNPVLHPSGLMFPQLTTTGYYPMLLSFEQLATLARLDALNNGQARAQAQATTQATARATMQPTVSPAQAAMVGSMLAQPPVLPRLEALTSFTPNALGQFGAAPIRTATANSKPEIQVAAKTTDTIGQNPDPNQSKKTAPTPGKTVDVASTTGSSGFAGVKHLCRVVGVAEHHTVLGERSEASEAKPTFLQSLPPLPELEARKRSLSCGSSLTSEPSSSGDSVDDTTTFVSPAQPADKQAIEDSSAFQRLAILSKVAATDQPSAFGTRHDPPEGKLTAFTPLEGKLAPHEKVAAFEKVDAFVAKRNNEWLQKWAKPIPIPAAKRQKTIFAKPRPLPASTNLTMD